MSTAGSPPCAGGTERGHEQGFPAGSGVDVIARPLQDPLEKDLGTQLVFDYKVGAGGNVASEVVAKARPDGYTICSAPRPRMA